MNLWALAELFFFLVAAHAVCDYPLQGDYLARSKNPRLCGDSAGWAIHLLYHATIHGAAVALVTQCFWMGLWETGIHAAIDYAKCRAWISGRVDQGLHLACKVAWALMAWPTGGVWLLQ